MRHTLHVLARVTGRLPCNRVSRQVAPILRTYIHSSGGRCGSMVTAAGAAATIASGGLLHSPARAYAGLLRHTRTALNEKSLFPGQGKKENSPTTDGEVDGVATATREAPLGECEVENLLERQAEEEEEELRAAAASTGASTESSETNNDNGDGVDVTGVAVQSPSSSSSPLGEPTGAPPPARRVRRYYIPGLDDLAPQEENLMYSEDEDGFFRPLNSRAAAAAVTGNSSSSSRGKNGTATKASASSSAPLTAAEGPPQQQRDAGARSAKTRNKAVSAGEEISGTSSPVASSLPARTQPRAKEAGSGASTAEKTRLPQLSPGKQAEAPVDVYDTDDPRVFLPNALVRDIIEKNKHIKTILMAALGSDFAKAGTSNDGVRTSFSVVSYQTVKQRTGLKSIPSKLLLSCLTSPDGAIDWIDISAHPTATLTEYKEAIQGVLVGLGMHSTMVDDSTEPMLLPQVTVAKDCRSLLIRYAIDVQGNKRMDSFQDLTNRFTLFVTDERVITVHRTQCTYVEELKKNWQDMLEGEDGRVTRYLLHYFVKETVQTFMRAISKCIVEFDYYEAGLFSTTRMRASLAREIYHIKRRAAVYGRTLTLTKDAYTHMSTSMDVYPSNVHYQEVLHDLAHMESLAEELNANADSVLQLLFQLSSYQVNELMRVLTLFSAFFIPLSFIASVYGMNFENMPFMNSPYGEYYCVAIMIAVATTIYLWFRAKHFI